MVGLLTGESLAMANAPARPSPLTGRDASLLGEATDFAALVARMQASPTNIRFAEACKVADHFFGPARQTGTIHRIWRTPWQGDPRVNMQNDHGKAKACQVRRLVDAIERLRRGPSGKKSR